MVLFYCSKEIFQRKIVSLYLTLITLGFLTVVFSGDGQFGPHLKFQVELM